MIAARPERPTRRDAVVAMLTAGLGAACRAARTGSPDATAAVDQAAQRYVRLTSELAQHQPSLVEAWAGAVDLPRGARRPVAAIHDEVDQLLVTLDGVVRQAGPSPRLAYLAAQVKALKVAARRLSGEFMTFADEAAAALAVAPSTWRSGTETLARVRAGLDAEVPGRGPLHDRVNAFRRRHAIEPVKLETAFIRAIAACRERAAPFLALPSGESVTVEREADVGFEARAIWKPPLQTVVRLDTHAAPDVAHLLWLAAHETYGGHHLQHVLVAGGGAFGVERKLQPSFGAHLLHAEGAAETGAWWLLEEGAFSDACARVCRDLQLDPSPVNHLVGIRRAMLSLDLVVPQIAESYLDGGLSQSGAIERLASEALVADPPSFLTVIERQRTRVLAYPVGRRLVSAAVGAGPAEQRWARLKNISATLIVEARIP